MDILYTSILPEKYKMGKRQGIRIEDLKEFDLAKISSTKYLQDNEVQKNIIHFGNPNLKTVINIMIGIKSAVSKIGSIPIRNLDLKISYLFPVDNLGVYEEMNRFMYEQNNYDGIVKCKFYDYAPKIFYNLRTLYGISNDDYLKSLGPENFLCNLIITKNKSLKEICSSGKSGSFFYFSYDGKYLMKTIPEGEFLKFKEMLQDYYTYMYDNPKTLLQRFFGLYMCIFDDVKMYFVVMNNVFNTPLKVHYKYDLKGSTYKRISRKCKEINYTNYDFDIAMKDNDFTDRNEKVYLSSYFKRLLFEEAKRDSKFLSDHNINDYSFLIGVNDQKWYNKEQLEQEQYLLLSNKNNGNSFKSTVTRKPFFEEYYGGIQSEENDKVYFFGIIDIFTNYGATKKMEYIFKSVGQGTGISCKPPNEYSNRFINFLESILNTDNDNKHSYNHKKKNNNNE
jgi:1-phosphatidylinositol-4-phosphate 5-kinase